MPKELRFKKRETLTSPKIKELAKKKKKAHTIRVVISALCMCSLLAGFVVLSRWEKINIESIEIVGNQVVETSLIASVIEAELSGKYLGLIPKTNFALYPEKRIKSALENNFQRLKDIKVKTKNPKTLSVTVGERSIQYAWCGLELPLRELSPEEKHCYFLDETGYIFDQTPYFSGNVYFRFYGATDNSINPLGSYFDTEHFESLVFYKDNLEKLGLKPIALLKKADGEVEFILDSLKLGEPKVLIKLADDRYKVVEALTSALNTGLKKNLAEKYAKLRYLDLRFDNKVYYKFDD